MIEPTEPTAKMTPSWTDERWRTRTAYRMKIANRIWPKKFDVPVHPAIARSWRLPSTHASPSFTCGHILGRGSSASWRGRVSRCFIRSMNTVETTKLAASTTIAYGAVIAAMRPPVMLGPPTCATETVSCSFELPSTRCSRSISAGRYDW